MITIKPTAQKQKHRQNLIRRQESRKELDWHNPEELFMLTRGVATSVYDSLKHLGSEYPAGHLNLKPSFVTQKTIDACKQKLAIRENFSGDCYDPKLSIDILHGNKVQLALYGIYESKNFIEMDRWDLKEAQEHKKSIEDFFNYIAEKCYSIVEANRQKFKDVGSLIVNCGLIFRPEVNQLSLTDAMLNKWSLKSTEDDECQPMDLVSLFNHALKKTDKGNFCTIHCSHIINDCVSVLAGMNIREKPVDIMVTMNQGQNICFFYGQHKVKGYECDKMIVNSDVFNIGDFLGSADHELLCKFITPIEDVLKTASKHDQNLLPKLTSGFNIAEAIRKHVNSDFPDLAEQFTWLKSCSAISESDISNFLEYTETGKSQPSRLTSVYLALFQHQKPELKGMCRTLIRRSAGLMAAVTLGFIRALCYANKLTNKITVGLDGSMMLHMFGYKQMFMKTVKELQITASQMMPFEPVIKSIDFVESANGDMELCNVLIAEHINTSVW